MSGKVLNATTFWEITMHGFSKVMLGIGVAGLILSIAMMIFGYGTAFSSMDSEAEQDLIWEQFAPASWDASDIDQDWDYFVYVSDSGNVSVELIGSDEYNYFISCESTSNCDSSTISGYTYVGELYAIGDRDARTLHFNGSGSVQIWADEGYLDDGFLTAGLGVWGCCCSILFLIIGGISAAVIKDNNQNIVVLGQPGFVSQPQFVQHPTIQQQPTPQITAVQQPTLQYQQQAIQQPQMATQQSIQQPNPTVPTNQPIVNPAVEQSTGSPPPIPAEGLPPGWDMQQWECYGHDWLRQQGRV